jgi:hypothetical protein
MGTSNVKDGKSKMKGLTELVKEFEEMKAIEQLEYIKKDPFMALSIIAYYQGWIRGYEKRNRED